MEIKRSASLVMVEQGLDVLTMSACNTVLMKLNATSFSTSLRLLDAFFTGFVTRQEQLRIVEPLLKSRALKSLLRPQRLSHRYQRQLKSRHRLHLGKTA